MNSRGPFAATAYFRVSGNLIQLWLTQFDSGLTND